MQGFIWPGLQMRIHLYFFGKVFYFQEGLGDVVCVSFRLGSHIFATNLLLLQMGMVDFGGHLVIFIP